ncbi:MAG: hypothetical protein ACHQ50_07575 [Fimbriimonadales bacterium]
MCLFLLMLALASCGGKPRSIVGEWSTRANAGNGTMIFRDDLTFRTMTETPLASLILDGTYDLKGDDLRLHVIRWDVPKGLPMTEEDKRTMSASLQTDAVSALSWSDDDHFRLVGAQGELTTAERVSK